MNLTTATARTIALPGFNESLVWHGTQIIVAAAHASMIDPGSGRVTHVPYDGYEVVATAEPGAAVRELDSGGVPAVLRTWTGASPHARKVADVPAGAEWFQPGQQRDNRVAAQWVAGRATPGGPPSMVVVMDARDAHVQRRLLLTTGRAERSAGCCAVVGWLDQHTVLVSVLTDAERIIGWDIDSGNLTLVSTIDSHGVDVTFSLVGRLAATDDPTRHTR